MITILNLDRCVLLHGDSSALPLPENSVDSIVCDPPAGIAFMGKEWDKDKGGRDSWIQWLSETLGASYRALKPGGHALVWAIPRTSHWAAMALELAGFEIRDVVSHFFGSGFPKGGNRPGGTGTGLKPACENWILARKPFKGTIKANRAKWGTGVLWIDRCRIGTEDNLNGGAYAKSTKEVDASSYALGRGIGEYIQPAGRWPAHVTLEHSTLCTAVGTTVAKGCKADKSSRKATPSLGKSFGTKEGHGGHSGIPDQETDLYACVPSCPVRALDSQVPPSKSTKGKPRKGASGDGYGMTHTGAEYEDSGGPSRFFYVAKPSRAEKELGCEELTPKSGAQATGRKEGSQGVDRPQAGANRGGGRRNFHPTVKSTALMGWLIRLITPPGGIVLDPFAGSGSTGVAALLGGYSFIGCELTDEYIPIIKARLEKALT